VLSVSAAVCVVSLADCTVSLVENPCSQSLFLRAFTAQSDGKPVEPVFVLLTSRRLPYFSPLSSLLFLPAPFSQPTPPTHFSLSPSHSHHSKTHLYHPPFGSFVGGSVISASSIISLNLVGISVIQTSDRGITLFHFVYSISPVLDYLVYRFLDTFEFRCLQHLDYLCLSRTLFEFSDLILFVVVEPLA
jgi:hypothetical protein